MSNRYYIEAFGPNRWSTKSDPAGSRIGQQMYSLFDRTKGVAAIATFYDEGAAKLVEALLQLNDAADQKTPEAALEVADDNLILEL